MKLFWVTTKDHDKDWFVAAAKAADASRFFECSESYDPGSVATEFVMEIPVGRVVETGWPSDEMLISLGADFVYESLPRVVEINGKIYIEGTLESELGATDLQPSTIPPSNRE